jgi:hypothetical protein
MSGSTTTNTTSASGTGETMTTAAKPTTSGANDRADVLRRALVELKTARAEAAEARQALTEPIAVVLCCGS